MFIGVAFGWGVGFSILRLISMHLHLQFAYLYGVTGSRLGDKNKLSHNALNFVKEVPYDNSSNDRSKYTCDTTQGVPYLLLCQR